MRRALGHSESLPAGSKRSKRFRHSDGIRYWKPLRALTEHNTTVLTTATSPCLGLLDAGQIEPLKRGSPLRPTGNRLRELQVRQLPRQGSPAFRSLCRNVTAHPEL